MADPTTELVPAADRGIGQFVGHQMFEHYQEDGYLIVVTSDATALRLEPGDFIVKRLWSTAVVPYIYNEARPDYPPVRHGSGTAALHEREQHVGRDDQDDDEQDELHRGVVPTDAGANPGGEE